MPTCYAAQLGGCSPKMSLEHFVSAGVLRQIHDDGPIVNGWPGIHVTKRVPVQALGSRILCTTHNQGLSSLDSTASTFFEAVRAYDCDLAGLDHPPTAAQSFHDGRELERWLLKVAVGLSAIHERHGAPVPTRGSSECLEVLFGLRDWPSDWGLYVQGVPDSQVLAPADVAITTGLNPATRELWQLTAWVRFLPLHLCLGRPDGEHWEYRPGAFDLDLQGSAAHKQLILSWRDARQHPTIRLTRVGSIDRWGDLPG